MRYGYARVSTEDQSLGRQRNVVPDKRLVPPGRAASRQELQKHPQPNPRGRQPQSLVPMVESIGAKLFTPPQSEHYCEQRVDRQPDRHR